MKTTVELVDPEESHPIVIDGRDRRAFEREAHQQLGPAARGALQDVVKAMPETYVLWCAWHSLKRTGVNIDWAEFETRTVAVESEGDDELGDPTTPAATGV